MGTTLNPDTRRLMPVMLGGLDFAGTEALITKLMGKGEAAARRELDGTARRLGGDRRLSFLGRQLTVSSFFTVVDRLAQNFGEFFDIQRNFSVGMVNACRTP